MLTRLIALAGLAGSGKNTVADILGGQHFSFAGPLKETAREVFGFTDAQLYGPSEERNRPDERYPREHGPWVALPCPRGCCSSACACCGISTHGALSIPACHLTPRYALQTLGTEWGRSCYPDVWAALGVRRAQDYLAANPKSLAVLTDCRFVNEARAVCDAGGEVWRIVRPGARLAGGATHPSEVEQQSPEFDALVSATVRNTGTLDELRDEVWRVRLGLTP